MRLANPVSVKHEQSDVFVPVQHLRHRSSRDNMIHDILDHDAKVNREKSFAVLLKSAGGF
jgi:hypothetical protein